MRLTNIRDDSKNVLEFFGFTKRQPEEQIISEYAPIKLEGERVVLYSWEALARPHRQVINKKFAKTLIVIGVVICFLLALMQEFVVILAIASIIFMSHALSSVPPEKVKHEISNHGITFAGDFYSWNDLKYFFFSNSLGGEILAVDTKANLPGRLFFSFEPSMRGTLREIFSKYLPFLDKEPLNFMDKAYLGLMNKLNFEDRP